MKGKITSGSTAEQLAAAAVRSIRVGLHQASSGPGMLLGIRRGFECGHLGKDSTHYDSWSALGSGRHPSQETKPDKGSLHPGPSHLCSLPFFFSRSPVPAPFLCTYLMRFILHLFFLCTVFIRTRMQGQDSQRLQDYLACSRPPVFIVWKTWFPNSGRL